MIKKRCLPEEIDVKESLETSNDALDISVDRVKDLVNKKIASASKERNSNTMKSKKKMVLIAVAATLVLGITVFAASGIVSQWSSSSSSIPDYKTPPSSEQVVKDIGYEAVVVDEFENGYKFKNGSIVDNNLKDENGKSIEKFKSLTFRYEKAEDKVIFSQDKFNSTIEIDGEVITTIDDIDVYYTNFTNKFVPEDYELTEEDKKAKESGELEFSYGTDKIEIIEVQGVSWIKDGVRCQLMQFDGNLSANELSEMAKEIIGI